MRGVRVASLEIMALRGSNGARALRRDSEGRA